MLPPMSVYGTITHLNTQVRDLGVIPSKFFTLPLFLHSIYCQIIPTLTSKYLSNIPTLFHSTTTKVTARAFCFPTSSLALSNPLPSLHSNLSKI